MKRIRIIAIAVLILILLLIWSPWISDDYAINRVTDELGGPNAKFNYLGEEMLVKDVPKQVAWFPFVKAVCLPSEAVWFVTFYGGIL